MTMAETTRPQPHFSGEPRPLRSLSRSPFSADLNERDIARDLSNVARPVLLASDTEAAVGIG